MIGHSDSNQSSRFSRFLVFAGVWLVIAFVVGTYLPISNQVSAQDKVFTAEELSQFDGKDGRPAYYAYEGKVYDVTGSKLWEEGEHFGIQAGQDTTGMMGEAPHGTEVFAPFEVLGTFEGAAEEAKGISMATTEQTNSPWFQGRIRIMGFSILGWTGILLGFFFVLTFASCFTMPWGKLPLPWAGARPGPDPLDGAAKHLTLSSLHKHFVWFTVILGIVHGILGLLQMYGLYL